VARALQNGAIFLRRLAQLRSKLWDALEIWLKSNIQLFAERETICVCLNVSKLDRAQVGHTL